MDHAYAAEDGTGREKQLVRRLVFLGLWVTLIVLIVSRSALGTAGSARRVTMERMAEIGRALDRYALDNGGEVPDGDQHLEALLEKPTLGEVPRNWRGPYLENEETILDGWGRRFQYCAPGGSDVILPDVEAIRPYDLWSPGLDRREDGAGQNADIRSWEPQSLIP